jgi:hypothetical protein
MVTITRQIAERKIMDETLPMTSHKAIWTAVASALVSIILMAAGVIPVDLKVFTEDLTTALSLTAAVIVQALASGGTAYFKRNYLK